MSKKVTLTDEMVLILIKEIKSHGSIWNHEDDDFNDRFQTMTAWKEISKAMDLPEDVVKAKWKNLRDLFKREIRKNRVKNLEDYSGKWRHFKNMWFLHRPGDVLNNNDDEENDIEDNQINYEELEATEHFVKFEPAERGEEIYLGDELDPIPDKRRRYNDDDFDMMYLKSLTPYFRQLDPIRKLVVRSKIQDMLINEIAAQSACNNPKISFK